MKTNRAIGVLMRDPVVLSQLIADLGKGLLQISHQVRHQPSCINQLVERRFIEAALEFGLELRRKNTAEFEDIALMYAIDTLTAHFRKIQGGKARYADTGDVAKQVFSLSESLLRLGDPDARKWKWKTRSQGARKLWANAQAIKNSGGPLKCASKKAAWLTGREQRIVLKDYKRIKTFRDCVEVQQLQRKYRPLSLSEMKGYLNTLDFEERMVESKRKTRPSDASK